MRHDLFSTPVWHIEGTPLELIDELHQGAYRFKENCPSETRSNQGGYQSPPLEWNNFHPYGIEVVKDIVSKAIEQDFKVHEWWYNINGKGHWNIPHTHPNSDLALVIYLTDSDGLLQLINPHLMRTNSQHYTGINAKRGDILIFPSDLLHYVMPNPREEDRISISMNLQLC